MDILLILTYTAICVAVFKIFKIPMNKWTVPTAVLGGIFLIGTLLILMNYNHPYSEVSRKYFQTTPIVPAVRGRVISVDVKPNTPLKAGDILFKIDPEPFQYKVDSLAAQLTSLKIDLQRAEELMLKQVGKQRDVDVMQSKVDDVQAQLKDAQYDLEQTVVRASTDGFVSQLLINPGLYVVPLPLKPAMVFVHTDVFTYIAWFRQNSMLRLKSGDKAEVAFDGVPGVIFSAEVIGSIPVMAEGELQAMGDLYDMYSHIKPGRIPVMINITDPEYSAYADSVPGGAYAQTAVYSEHFHHVAVIRKVLLRMSSWMNYIFPLH